MIITIPFAWYLRECLSPFGRPQLRPDMMWGICGRALKIWMPINAAMQDKLESFGISTDGFTVMRLVHYDIHNHTDHKWELQ